MTRLFFDEPLSEELCETLADANPLIWLSANLDEGNGVELPLWAGPERRADRAEHGRLTRR